MGCREQLRGARLLSSLFLGKELHQDFQKGRVEMIFRLLDKEDRILGIHQRTKEKRKKSQQAKDPVSHVLDGNRPAIVALEEGQRRKPRLVPGGKKDSVHRQKVLDDL